MGIRLSISAAPLPPWGTGSGKMTDWPGRHILLVCMCCVITFVTPEYFTSRLNRIMTSSIYYVNFFSLLSGSSSDLKLDHLVDM